MTESLQAPALLVIDIQQGLVAKAHEPSSLLTNTRLLLARAQQTGIPVVYLQHNGKPGTLVETGTAAWELQPEIVTEGATVFQKLASDSFYKTPLSSWLQERGVQTLVLTGMKSERCVDTTARSAITRGFDVVLAGDAHSTMDSPVLTAEQLILHTNANLQGFATDTHQIRVLASEAIHFE